MSSPHEDQPLVRPDPRPAQFQYVPPQAQWQPSPPAPKPNNGLAIAAIVVACIALVIGFGVIFSQIATALLFGLVTSSMGGFPDGPGLEGTAPQVVAGQPYPGRLLQDEVSRVIGGAIGGGGGLGGTDTSIACPATPAVVADAVTLCHGVVDGSKWSYRVTFEDDMGHFTLDEKVD